jgi:N-acetyl-gamma-glutamyl-phosphate reductase
MIRAAIIGGAGYTGGELTRLLLRHPGVELTFIHSRSNSGKPVSSVHTDLLGETDLQFTADLSGNVDVLFLCVGHGEARKFLDANKIDPPVRVIDLSQDFRLADNARHGERSFTYGLPELDRENIRGASNVANPGCFATAIQLGLLPLAAAGMLPEAHTTGITGSTGAGQGLSATSHFSWRANNIQAYKTLAHQHMSEINQSLARLQPHYPEASARGEGIHFVPWRGDFTRGIFISSLLTCSLSIGEVEAMYEDYYHNHPFTFLSSDAISLKQVLNTNKCVVQVEKEGAKLVVHTAIDNLLKGASGQAVHNMNLLFGLDECTGLQLKASGF